MKRKLTLIDLFAGCGGLSLGLEQAGFEPIFVNELNQDAMNTYLHNRLVTHPKLAEKFNINDIKKLVNTPERLETLIYDIKREYKVDINKGELDLVAGGPPCQGFSGIGHRRSYSVDKKQLPSNHLYQDMAYVISKLRPKIFLFENVKGLLTARWTKSGEKGEIWKDVLKTFRKIPDYTVRFSLVHAKDYGVPQNRPRVLLVGIRNDVGYEPDDDRPDKVAAGFLPNKSGNAPDLEDVLGDLLDRKYKNGGVTEKYPSKAITPIQKMLRRNPKTGRTFAVGSRVSEHEYSKHADHVIEKFKYMIKNNSEIPEHLRTKKFAQKVLPKKWGGKGPTITATSLPDDYVHFSQPRILTVREWARLQLFPDWYEFCGKRTTGGVRRAGNPRDGLHDREVPKYTQIGNAVPVGLAKAVGEHFASILKKKK